MLQILFYTDLPSHSWKIWFIVHGFAIWNYKNSFLIHLEIPEITEDHFQVHPIFLPNKLNFPQASSCSSLRIETNFFLNLCFYSVSFLKYFIKNSTPILPSRVLSHFMTTKLLNYIFSLSLKKKTCISEIKTLNQNTQKVRGRK